MKRLLFTALSVFLLFASTDGYSSERLRIAILDLKPTKVPATTAKAVSDLLRTRLIDEGLFTVVERNQMDDILKEQGFQQTGCTDASCAVQIGKLLSANKMLIGEVSRLGSAIMLTCRIVDVEKGVAEYATQEKAATEDTLDTAVAAMVKKLTRRIGRRRISLSGMVSGSAPSGVYVTYSMFLPSDSGVSGLYESMSGAEAGYLLPLNRYVFLQGSASLVRGTNEDAAMMFTSGSAGALAGVPLFSRIFPFVGIALQGTWVRESSDAESADFSGYGAGGIAGLHINVYKSLGIFARYTWSWARATDEENTDIGGQYFSAGLVYRI